MIGPSGACCRPEALTELASSKRWWTSCGKGCAHAEQNTGPGVRVTTCKVIYRGGGQSDPRLIPSPPTFAAVRLFGAWRRKEPRKKWTLLAIIDVQAPQLPSVGKKPRFDSLTIEQSVIPQPYRVAKRASPRERIDELDAGFPEPVYAPEAVAAILAWLPLFFRREKP